jgi:hypothetical protein
MDETITIVIDFDGTVVTHDYPFMGKDIGSVKILNKLVKSGHRLILFTMRSGDTLREAITWFIDNGVPLYGIQTNPTQESWTSSPKAYGNLYIDDAAIFAPLTEDITLSDRPFIDWVVVEKELMKLGLI